MLKPRDTKNKTSREIDELAEARLEKLLPHLDQNLNFRINPRQKSSLRDEGVKFKIKSLGILNQFMSELKAGVISGLARKNMRLFETKTSPRIVSNEGYTNVLYQKLMEESQNFIPYPGYPKEPPPPGFYESEKRN